MNCDMMAEIHCGREITESEIGDYCVAHINYGNKPHEWRRMYQCKDCKAKADAIRAGAAGQETWAERRRDAGLSTGQMARLMNLGTAVYSRLEHQREIAPDAVRRDFDRIVGGEQKHECRFVFHAPYELICNGCLRRKTSPKMYPTECVECPQAACSDCPRVHNGPRRRRKP